MIAETSRRLKDLGIRRATLLIDRARAEANIARFAERARASDVTLRPHFKTHQSADVASWFRTAGIDRATVSSLGQAAYFADHGWNDLTLAVTANPGEVADYAELAQRIRLGLLVDDPGAVAALAAGPFRIWIEIDVGYGRTGVPWTDHDRLRDIARQVADAPGLDLSGLLTHAGHTYGAGEPATAATVFATTGHRLRQCRDALAGAGLPRLAISAGDTPGFAATGDWSGIDEARPGNFVFFDLMQLDAGACGARDLACAVACPVIGVYPERGEVAVHAGAVHLSKERLDDGYGRLLTLRADGFGDLLPGWSVRSLSQEHGILAAENPVGPELAGLRPGDLLLIAPVHSCLTCEQYASYRTLDGVMLSRYRRT